MNHRAKAKMSLMQDIKTGKDLAYQSAMASMMLYVARTDKNSSSRPREGAYVMTQECECMVTVFGPVKPAV